MLVPKIFKNDQNRENIEEGERLDSNSEYCVKLDEEKSGASQLQSSSSSLSSVHSCQARD